MADWWPFDRSWADELKRNWTEVLNMSSAAAQSLGLPQPGFLPGDPFGAIVEAARAWLIGKKRTLRFSGRADGGPGQERPPASRPPACARGRAGPGGGVRRGPGRLPLAGHRVFPVELTMQAGIPQVGVAGAPWVRLEVEASAGGGSLRVQPRAVHLLERRLSLRSPAFHLPVPELPSGFVLTSVEPAPGGFVVRGMLSEWQRSVARDDIEHILGRPPRAFAGWAARNVAAFR
jgi:hypothetical protein